MIHRRITALFGRNEYGDNWLQRNQKPLAIFLVCSPGLITRRSLNLAGRYPIALNPEGKTQIAPNRLPAPAVWCGGVTSNTG